MIRIINPEGQIIIEVEETGNTREEILTSTVNNKKYKVYENTVVPDEILNGLYMASGEIIEEEVEGQRIKRINGILIAEIEGEN